jgi:CheY-like chemotaxis protein
MNRARKRTVKIEQYTILLVEDDPDDIILIKHAFAKSNIENPIQVVEDGEEAIPYLAGKGHYRNRKKYLLPILILLDLKLPRTSGHDVLEWARGQPGVRRLTVVVLTSSQKINDINRAYDLGANSYLVKPFTFDGLLDMVKTLSSYWFILNEKPEVDGG